MRRSWALVAALVLGAVLAMSGCAASGGGNAKSASSAEVVVPDLSGFTQASASSVLAKAGLKAGEVTTQTGGDPNKDITVCEQAVKAGTKVPSGSTVAFTVAVPAASSAEVKVPDMVGQQLKCATLGITGEKLKPEIVYEASTKKAGIVIKMDPAPGTMVPEGTTVKLYVSKG